MARFQLLGLFSLLVVTNSATAGVYSAAVLADNPVAYYRLNETTLSTAADASAVGGAQDGAYINFATGAGSGNIAQAGPRPTDLVGGQPLLGFNADNRAPHFAGEQGDAADRTRVEVPDSAALDITGALTLEAWVNPDSLGTSSNNGIVVKYRGSGNQRAYNLFVDQQSAGNVGGPGLVISDDGAFNSAGEIVETDTPLATGEWSHVVATYVPDTSARLWVNGVMVEELTGTAVLDNIASTSAPLWIGAQFDLSNARNFFDGLIDEVAVYDYALDDVDGNGTIDTNNRVTAHFNAALTAPIPEPATFGLILLGLTATAGIRRRR